MRAARIWMGAERALTWPGCDLDGKAHLRVLRGMAACSHDRWFCLHLVLARGSSYGLIHLVLVRASSYGLVRMHTRRYIQLQGMQKYRPRLDAAIARAEAAQRGVDL